MNAQFPNIPEPRIQVPARVHQATPLLLAQASLQKVVRFLLSVQVALRQAYRPVFLRATLPVSVQAIVQVQKAHRL